MVARPEDRVSNIAPGQVRKLAGWGPTQHDRANFFGCSQSPVVFLIKIAP